MFNIPDIRYFWTDDERFIKQFNGDIIQFKPYSKFPPVYKDISLWIEEKFNDGVWYKFNDFCEVIREIGGDSIEEVKLIDEFKKSDKLSHCYRITFRSNDKTLTDEEVNDWYFNIRKKLIDLNFNLR